MYLIEKSLTVNRYPKHPIAVVTQTAAPSAALRPLAINLSFLRRMPRSDETTEYAVTTQASAKANWPNCAAMFSYSFLRSERPPLFPSRTWKRTWPASYLRQILRRVQVCRWPWRWHDRSTCREGD